MKKVLIFLLCFIFIFTVAAEGSEAKKPVEQCIGVECLEDPTQVTTYAPIVIEGPPPGGGNFDINPRPDGTSSTMSQVPKNAYVDGFEKTSDWNDRIESGDSYYWERDSEKIDYCGLNGSHWVQTGFDLTGLSIGNTTQYSTVTHNMTEELQDLYYVYNSGSHDVWEIYSYCTKYERIQKDFEILDDYILTWDYTYGYGGTTEYFISYGALAAYLEIAKYTLEVEELNDFNNALTRISVGEGVTALIAKAKGWAQLGKAAANVGAIFLLLTLDDEVTDSIRADQIENLTSLIEFLEDNPSNSIAVSVNVDCGLASCDWDRESNIYASDNVSVERVPFTGIATKKVGDIDFLSVSEANIIYVLKEAYDVSIIEGLIDAIVAMYTE